ncbi:MAG: VOC family protein [bacterium]|nr:VOC family protein [bacterium]
MKPTLSVITLGVADMRRAIDFYKNRLGWPTRAADDAGIAFFQLNGIILALYPRVALADEANVSASGAGFSGVTLSHNVASREEVDQVLFQAERAGASIVKPACDASWGGYSSFFADPDGYLWEVVHNPHWDMDEHGGVMMKKAEG